jgi:5-methylcytosine-specific restriction endonuclease McrA
MERTLLLTRGYEPISVISWQRAIRLQVLDKVEVVETWDAEVRSVRFAFKVPAVVRLVTAFSLHQQRIKFSRQNVLARDRWRCQYCGAKHPAGVLTLDHVLPRSRGGKTSWENIVTACSECNSTKGSRTPEEAGMRLRKHPQRPRWLPMLALVAARRAVPPVWSTYCRSVLSAS